MKVAPLAIGTLLLAAGNAWAHRAPNSLVSLDFTPGSVRAELLVPISELAYATAADTHGEAFAAYLLRHVAVESPTGARWAVNLRAVRRTSTPTRWSPALCGRG